MPTTRTLDLSIGDVMLDLAKLRPIFHSEADFQHAVAWEIHRRLPNASVTLERPYRTSTSPLHLDMLIRFGGQALAVELKYKTAKLSYGGVDDHYTLLNQSAQDLGRYDFIKDIWRLEAITKAIPNCRGWAIILTNDSGYWNASKRSGTVDSEFRLSEGGTLRGTRGWVAAASAGTMKNRERPIVLESTYGLSWHKYSEITAPKNGHFRYVGLEVRNDG
jgi:hypothetical protein